MRKTGIAVILLPTLTALFFNCQVSQEVKVPEQLEKEIIVTEAAPKAIGPYSQGVKVGNWLFASGQIAIDPGTGELVVGDFEKEVRQVLDNLGGVLRAADMDYGDVVQATVFLSDLENYGKLNEVYAEYFKRDFPARCAVQVARLPKDVNVEIAITAYKAK